MQTILWQLGNKRLYFPVRYLQKKANNVSLHSWNQQNLLELIEKNHRIEKEWDPIIGQSAKKTQPFISRQILTSDCRYGTILKVKVSF